MATYKETIEYIIKNGLAKTNRFQVIIPLPDKLMTNVQNKQNNNLKFLSTVIKDVSSYLGGG